MLSVWIHQADKRSAGVVFRGMRQRSESQRLRSERCPAAVCALRCCCVRCELWPCGALGNTGDCLSSCCDDVVTSQTWPGVWLSCEPLFSITAACGVRAQVFACMCVCVCMCVIWFVVFYEHGVQTLWLWSVAQSQEARSEEKGHTGQRSLLSHGLWRWVFTEWTQDAQTLRRLKRQQEMIDH